MAGGPFDLEGRVAVVTGGYGVLGGSIAEALGAAGAKVVVLGRNQRAAEAKAEALQRAGTAAIGLVADVLDDKALVASRTALLAEWGRVDILVNAAGGHVAQARTDNTPAFEMSLPAFDDVVRLNLHGTVYPTLVFGEAMARRGKGSIVNISSMAATLALSGVLGYSVAKAAIESFTRWMAVDLARRFGDGLRVNAIAPGFFVAQQNRAVLIRPDGSLTERAQAILARTPMGRFGDPAELRGPVIWLCSDAASFVTGAVVPIDGGFSADGGI
jgi:NAD(P)-dependent dehydrogenase (short-subunit alcohol dehydrogenase family)